MTVRGAALLLLAPAMLAQDPAPGLTAEKEAALGASMAKQFRERHGTLDLPEAQTYLERIVRDLAAAQPGDGPCCSVEIHTGGADASAWPEALPGGYLFVPARRFLTAPSEAEFVERLAHAVAHARTRDWIVNPGPRGDLASVPVIYLGSCDRSDAPMGMRQEYDARERRAETAAAELRHAVETGTGELERVRALVEARIGRFPPLGPRSRPSLLPRPAVAP
jgi:hypothetical protein